MMPEPQHIKRLHRGIAEGITKGYSDGTFKPDNQMLRKDVLIMLYRAFGCPDVTGEISFCDCDYPATSDTYKAILWASQNGITKGYGDGTFRPNDECTREQILTFLYRAVTVD